MRGARTRGAVLVVALAVVGVAPAVPAGAAAVRLPQVAPADPVCVGEAASVGEAAVLAAVCDVPVEVVGERTAWASTFALPDGSVRLDSSMAAVRTDVSGVWEPVDPSLVVTDGGVQVVSAVVPMVFSDGSDGMPVVRVERDGHEVVFDAPFVLTEPVVVGAQVTYPAVLPGVDLVVSVNGDATGFSQVLRVESAEAASNPALAELTFDVVTSDGVELRAEPSGGFAVTDGDGQVVLTSPAPAMWDSSTPGDAQAGPTFLRRDPGAGGEGVDPVLAPAPGVEAVAMGSEIGDETVTITPDADLLTDPGTQWPVFIDPGMSGSLNQRTAVRTVIGNAYNFPDTEGVGLCNKATSDTCSHTFKSRLLYQFAGLAGLGQLDPPDVQSAVFAVTGTHSYSCTPMPVTLYAVADFDQSTSYPGGGYWQPLQTQTIAHRPGCAAGNLPRRIEFDATSQARAVAAANTSVASFGIAADEDSMASWKRYAWDASFSVTYNRAPHAPLNARTTAPYAPCRTGAARPALRSATPTLRAVMHDPDAGNIHSQFAVYDIAASSLVWASGLQPAQVHGAEHAVTVPGGLIKDGRAYRWDVNGYDGSATGPNVSCEFTADLTPPVMPTVTPVAAMPAVYDEGPTYNGGIGVEGRFVLGRGTSSDVAAFRYTFTGQPTRTVPVGYSTVSFTPTTVGSHVLTVESIDGAGWVSPARTYRFTVGFAGLSDAWQLDEAAGGSAANASAVAAPLAVSAGVSRTDGPLTALFEEPGDRALVFDSPDDSAGTARPVVRTDASFSVMAAVRADHVGGTATAVSQDGSTVSGFELGVSSTGCGAGAPAPCWAFSVPTSDAGSARAVAVSDVPVVAGQWVQLTGMRDAGSGQVRLGVCVLGSVDEPGDMVARLGAAVPAASPWVAAGGFQLGRGKAAGAAAHAWRGAISQVRTYTGVLTIEQLRVACRNPAAIHPVLDPPPTPAPAPPPLLPAPGYHPGWSSTVHLRRGAQWFVNGPGDPSDQLAAFGYGFDSDVPVVGDWNGDGVETVGVVRGSSWHLTDVNAGAAPTRTFVYGNPGDVPVVGDWNGDGIDTVGVVRGVSWYLNDQLDGSAPEHSFVYGNPGDVPVVGDWNGDGIDTVGVFRRGYWYLNDQNDGSGHEYAFAYGNADDVPVVGDWNGDGIDTVGVFRDGQWFLNDENDGSAPEHVFLFGAPGDRPVRGSGVRP
jgi:hypothetical protein